jgi:hypothetical protein
VAAALNFSAAMITIRPSATKIEHFLARLQRSI